VRDCPRILVEPNAHHLLNHGDTAMLQVAVERLFALWPRASIQVLTENPARLERLCPGVLPVDVEGCRIWFDDYAFTYTLHRLLPRSASRRLVEIERLIRRRSPSMALRLMRTRTRLRGSSTSSLEAFVAVAADADLVVSTGAGAFTDHFAPLAMTILELFDSSKRRGAITAALSQGIGPITDRQLLQRASEVLPSLDLITIRERRCGGTLLEDLGVRPDRVVTTGDDAIEIAYRERRDSPAGGRLGFNLRMARYSHVDPQAAEAVGAAVRNAAERHAAEPLAIAISSYPNERDADVAARLLAIPVDNDVADTPQEVIARIQQCRTVVTGSYHAAVFALAQGIPAIGLTSSSYYDAKFYGLRDQFGKLLDVVPLSGGDLAARLGSAIDHAWWSAEERRVPLLELAARQVEAGRTAYGRLRHLLSARDGTS
jgi:polysaccharide pyruvyl transferase WcaK-like protein